MFRHTKLFVLTALLVPSIQAQSNSAPNLFNVLSWSSVFNQPVYNSSGVQIGTLGSAVPNVFAFGAGGVTATTARIVNNSLPTADFKVDTSIVQVNNAINSNIATALGVIPLASPGSGVIFQTDPATGIALPASSTLGPVFTERAETIGKPASDISA